MSITLPCGPDEMVGCGADRRRQLASWPMSCLRFWRHEWGFGNWAGAWSRACGR